MRETTKVYFMDSLAFDVSNRDIVVKERIMEATLTLRML